MKKRIMSLAAVVALGTLVSGNVGAVEVVGGEDFESYATGGTWSSPEANPQMYINGGNAAGQIATIMDDGGTNQYLQLGLNVSNMWQAGLTFEVAVSNNFSRDMNDYSLDFYWHMTAESVSNLVANNRYFVLNIRDTSKTIEGSEYVLKDYDIDYSTALAGGVITIPLSSTKLASGCARFMDGSAANWQFQFLISGNYWPTNEQFDITIDDMVVRYEPPVFLNMEWSPTWISATNPTVSVTLYDGTSEVDDMLLSVDGGLVASNNYAGGSTTNTISYDWNTATFGYHTGKVVAVDASLYSKTNSWVFFVPTTPPAAATNAIDVYSINFAGSTSGDGSQYWHPVTNGFAAAAPSAGSNNWYNLDYNNPYYVLWQYKTIAPASGNGNRPSLGYMLVNESSNFGLLIDWNWMVGWHPRPPFYASAANSIWAFSAGNLPFDAMFDFSGLPADRTCDMYLYYTNPDTTDPQTTKYTIMQDYGISAYPGAILVSDQTPLSGGYTNYWEGTNYVVITGITPNSGGTIRLRVEGDNGGLSAVQIVVRDDGQGVGSVVPTIQSYSQSSSTNGLMNDLTWDSESFVNYSVMKKTSLEDPTWTMVTNVFSPIYYPSATSVSLPASGNQEFFKIEGN